MSARREHLNRALLGMLPVALAIAAWQAACAFGLVAPALLPRPGAVFGRLAAQLVNPDFLVHAWATLYRLFAGFLIALLVGVTLGLAAGVNPALERALRPLVRILAPIPKIALYPVFILTMGFGDSSKIALVIADAVFPILLATLQGAAMVEPKLVWTARAAGTSPSGTIVRVILPATLPSILTGCRIGLVVACIVVFLAEMITSTDGLGYLLVRASRSFETVDMFVPLIAISLLGLALNGVLAAARSRLLVGFPDEA
jgi:ABC-type nitrate/sulfonate/bicarbonate transport system permease component